MESHLVCLYDYLEIRDGASVQSPLIARLCGDKDDVDAVYTSGPEAYIKFLSDYSYTEEGVGIKYTAVIGMHTTKMNDNHVRRCGD